MKEKAKGFMFYVAFVASLGGFLFGFDTVVVSGAEKGIQAYYGLSGWLHGFTMAVALFAPSRARSSAAAPPKHSEGSRALKPSLICTSSPRSGARS